MNRLSFNSAVSSLLRASFLLALVSVITATIALGDTVTYTGNTTGGPTWNRPLGGTPPAVLSAVGTAVHYSTQLFTVGSSGTYTFQSTSLNPVLWDNFTFLYVNSFNPLAQFTNALAGDDDNPSIGLSGFSFGLTAGTSYIFVTTGFANTDFGTFSNVISGPGTVNIAGAAVPESGVGAMIFGLAVAGLVLSHRRVRVA